MQGSVKTYLPEKGYGFIEGDDGKDYFFHVNGFRDNGHVDKICEGSIVRFDPQATPKGYKAADCTLVDPSEVLTYALPDRFIASRSGGARGWEVVDYAGWYVHGSSRDSPDAAKREAIENAKLLGANALLHLEYYKTTGSEPGTGDGTHHYTIHNFRGQPAVLAKKSARGDFRLEALTGLNRRAEEMKEFFAKKTRRSKRKRNLIWLSVIALSFGAYQIGEPLYIVGFALFGYFFGHSTDYDSWLERM